MWNRQGAPSIDLYSKQTLLVFFCHLSLWVVFLFFIIIIIIIQDSVGRSVGRLALIDAIFVDSVQNWWSSVRSAAAVAAPEWPLRQLQHVRGRWSLVAWRCRGGGGGFLTEDSGLETGDREVNVVPRRVKGDLPLQGRRSLLKVDDMRASQSHAQLSSLVRRRALDLFFLTHGNEFLKDFGEESDLFSPGQLLQHRLQEQLLVIRRIHEDSLVEDVAVVVLAGQRRFLDVAHDGVGVGSGVELPTRVISMLYQWTEKEYRHKTVFE